jgi:large subunit ribosomal protein L21
MRRGKQVSMQAYAVIETGGKQYLVKEGSVLDVEKLAGQPGAAVDIERVLAISDGKTLKVGAPTVSGAKVTAKIVEAFRGPKLIVFKKKRRKGYHKKAGHRQPLLKLQITAISA